MKKRNNRLKGAILSQALIVFVIATMAFTVLCTLFTYNHQSAVLQEGRAQAYYLTLTGIDLATSALLDDSSGEKLLDVMAKPESKTAVLEQKIEIDPSRNAVVDIEIKQVEHKSETWIQIYAEGTMLAPNNKMVSNKGICYINPKNPAIKEWQINKVG